jgi:tetratricopeptide (TPR) repeat protein
MLATAVLYVVLKKNNAKDCRYTIGLGISAIIAIITSILLPNIISAFSVDLAMQLALSFFIAILIYITVLFFCMMLIASIFPQKRIDKLQKKCEENKIKRHEAKELKLKLKAEEEAAIKKSKEVKKEIEAPKSEFCTEKTELNVAKTELDTVKTEQAATNEEIELDKPSANESKTKGSEETRIEYSISKGLKAEAAMSIGAKSEVLNPETSKQEALKPKASKPEKKRKEVTPEPKTESTLKNIFINRFSRQKVEEIIGEPTLEDQEDSLNIMLADDEVADNGGIIDQNEIHYEESGISDDKELDLDNDKLFDIDAGNALDLDDTKELDITADSALDLDDTKELDITADNELNLDDKKVLYIDSDNASGLVDEELFDLNDEKEILIDFEDTEIVPADTKPLESNPIETTETELLETIGTEPLNQANIFNQSTVALERTFGYDVSIEKNVDTPDIIDKMGVDKTPIENVPYLDSNGLSLNEIIDKAFILKQNGREVEAASLYIEALDMKPDNEAAFWIILDICSIYKSAGQTELAEDILLTYIDEFEHLMSEEVKDQILQGLY